MDVLVVVLALIALMVIAYQGHSVIVFAPIVALGAVFCFQPMDVFPSYLILFMDKMAFFVKTYFPMFLLGALFGKVIELSGFSKSICHKICAIAGEKHVVLAIVLVGTVLSYSGVSAFVIVFAVYPFAAELFRISNIPKRFIPCTILLGGITYTMDALPGTPQIQNLIPTTFFKTTAYSAPILGTIGALFIFTTGLLYILYLIRRARRKNEGYDSGWALVNEPENFDENEKLPNFWIAMIPLLSVCGFNFFLTNNLASFYGEEYKFLLPGMKSEVIIDIKSSVSMWSVLIALFTGIVLTIILAFKRVMTKFAMGSKAAVSGCLLAIMNTASEYGYGSVIAVLPGFLYLSTHLHGFSEPLLGEMVAITTLAGIVGSASGGLSIAMGSMADIFISAADAAGIPLEVAHRVASMASGGLDTLPHNGAIITLLAVTGLTHKQAYLPIFGITLIKTSAVLVVIAVYYLTGWV